MGIELRPDQYSVMPVETILENEPVCTQNIHAADCPTVRLYRVFEAQVLDSDFCWAMMVNSRNYSMKALQVSGP